MGSVAAIEERQNFNLSLGIPAGTIAVLAAGISFYDRRHDFIFPTWKKKLSTLFLHTSVDTRDWTAIHVENGCSAKRADFRTIIDQRVSSILLHI